MYGRSREKLKIKSGQRQRIGSKRRLGGLWWHVPKLQSGEEEEETPDDGLPELVDKTEELSVPW